MTINFQRLLLVVLALCTVTAAADKRLRLQRAAVLENITVDGKPYQLLRGDVVITKDQVTVYCDRARYHERTDQGQLVGHVRITKNELTLTCDSLHYDSPNDLFKAYGNTHAWDPDYDLVADTLFYFSELDSGSARSNARLIQESQVINADRLSYWKPPEADAASYIAERNVKITEGQRVATCGRALYSREEEFTILQIDPVVEEDGQLLSGSEIELHYRNEVLETMYIPDKAHVVYHNQGFRQKSQVVDDSTIVYRIPIEFNDDMTGTTLKGFFIDGEMDSLRLEGMATTLYHIFEDSVYQGNNAASGDTIIMNFGDSELEKIFLIGGARGTYTPDTSNSDIEDPIVYASQFINYNLAAEETDLWQSATIDYGDVNLKAGFVKVAWRNNLLKALPTLPGDSTVTEIRPTITERGKEPMYGESMTYNLKNRHGSVTTGRTKSSEGYYGGQDIRNIDKKVFYIDHSHYTTCDLDTPHFHFEGQKMKIIHGDKIVAKPIVLYIAGIPIIGLPFAIFPDQGGRRHSGWIMPGYGESSNRGQYLQGLGYFWAPSDYWDSKLLFSFYDKRGLTLSLGNNYKKRYGYSGNFDLNVKQFLDQAGPDIVNIFKPGTRTEFGLRWNHTQYMRKNQSFRVKAEYTSTARYNDDEIDLEKRLEQKTTSNLTYSKSWPKSKNSFGFNLSATRDLMAERKIDSTTVYYQNPAKNSTISIWNNSMPNISFSHGTDYFFKSRDGNRRWYHNISWNYSASLKNSYRQYYHTLPAADSTGLYVWNPAAKDTSDLVITHSSTISGSQKLFKYINVNPSIGLSSKWLTQSYTSAGLDSSKNKIIAQPVDGFAARTTANFSLGFNTKLYGLFPVKIGALRYLRHTASPTLSLRFTPDYSKSYYGLDFGYYETATDTNGNVILMDRFNGGTVQKSALKESRSLSFSISNTFQAKMVKDDVEQKIDLFNYNISGISYNFVTEKFSTFSSNLSSKLGKKYNLSLQMSHDFYEYDEENQKPTDDIRRNKYGIPVPRLTSARMSQSFNFSGNRLLPFKGTADTTATRPIPEEELAGSNNPTNLVRGMDKTEDQQKPTAAGNKLWTATLVFSYTLSNPQMKNETQRFQVTNNIKLNITKNWRVTYSSYIDLINRNIHNHSFSISRDLHCWEMSLKWTPTGYGQGYYLIIQPKAPQLKDLKFEDRGGGYSRGLGY